MDRKAFLPDATSLILRKMVAADFESIKSMLTKQTGKSGQDVQQLIDAKKEKFSGLLTDAGAAIMIAKELGVPMDGRIREETRISDLREGMNNLDVMGRVSAIFPPREFERNGKKGRLQNLTLTDGTAEIRATLWHADIDKAQQLGVARGSAVKLSNCAVGSYNGALQLSMNYNSSLELPDSKSLPEAQVRFSEINDIEHGMNNVNVKVLIKKIFPAKEFENERGKGKVMNFIIAQGVEELRATAWNEMCEEVEGVGEGEKAIIEGAYAKEGMNGAELHLGRRARIMKEKEAD
ncbi:MAG TPA: DUF2240 family protein [Candidatus Diapherotrites archaeon]|uniref:DUF2240 family protein n=1 Tax=Candidatus Iainarchaeum sp. TaxID=3101447 RepID=A0A7J4J0S9_9ARCH|nr:DUF2240 family protein [Candidatus Diapherotrites archaeon]